MKTQEFSVNAQYDEAAQVVEVVIRCSPNLIRAGMDIAGMQVEEVVPREGAIAPALAAAPTHLGTTAPAQWGMANPDIWNRPEPILPRV